MYACASTAQLDVRAVSRLGASLSLCTRSLCWPHAALQAVGGAGPVRLQLVHLGCLLVQPEGCLPCVLWSWESEQSFWSLCCGVSLSAFPCETVEVTLLERLRPPGLNLKAGDSRLTAGLGLSLSAVIPKKESAQQPRPELLTTVPFTASAEFLKVPASGPPLHSDLPCTS